MISSLFLQLVSFCLVTVMAKSYSVVVGLNPALQKRFILGGNNPTLVAGNVHRASEVQTGIGGKGQDVAVTIGYLSNPGSSNVLLAQFLGKGPVGDLALSKVKESLHEGNAAESTVDYLTIRCEASLRTCTTIVAEDTATELVEPSGEITDIEVSQLLDKVNEISKLGEVRGLCFMGSMPPGCKSIMYADIFKNIMGSGSDTIVLIDSVVGIKELFREMKLIENRRRGSNMMKINFGELCKLAKVPIKTEIMSTNADHLKEIVKSFFENFKDASEALDFLAITNGCHDAFLVETSRHVDGVEIENIFQISVPSLSKVLHHSTKIFPIGAGDSVAGGTLAAWEYLNSSNNQENRLHPDIHTALSNKLKQIKNVAAVAFAYGVACGSASCVQEENSVVSVDDTLALFDEIDVRVIESICSD